MPAGVYSNPGLATPGYFYGSPGGYNTPGIGGDIATGIGALGNLYGLYQAGHLQGAAQDVFRQSNPFAGYRPMYGQQLAQLMQDPSSVTKLPGYQFLMDQGVSALDRSAAAPGGVGFGSTAEKGQLMQYGQGLADQFYNQQVQTLSSLAGAQFGPANPAAALAGMGAAQGSLGASGVGAANSIAQLISRFFPGGGGGSGVPDMSAIDPNSLTLPGFDPNSLLPTGYDPNTFDPYGGGTGTTDFSGYPQVASGIPYDAGATGGSLDLSGLFGPPSAAGGGAATSSGGLSTGQMFGVGAGLAGIGAGLASRNPVRAGMSAAQLASQYPSLFNLSAGAAKNLGTGAGALGNTLNIIQGLRTGGVSGYGEAGIGAAGLASKILGGTGLISGGAAQEISQFASYAAIPLSVYNFAKNWQSGSTGSDALSGASTGASIGSLFGPEGTLIGAGIGAVAGGISSAFGPGRMDPENVNWNSYAAAAAKTPQAVAGATPSQNFQALAGIFDARGSNIPFYKQYGRMGENQFTVAMANQVNSALRSGSIPVNASPQQIYAQIVQPWITKMGGQGGWQQTYTEKGAPEKGAIGDLLTNLISQWQQGMLSSTTPVGIKGQTISGLPGYGG